jgi:hypothetical protein
MEGPEGYPMPADFVGCQRQVLDAVIDALNILAVEGGVSRKGPPTCQRFHTELEAYPSTTADSLAQPLAETWFVSNRWHCCHSSSTAFGVCQGQERSHRAPVGAVV